MNKKGNALFALIILMVVSFMAILFFGGWIYASNLIESRLNDIGTINVLDNQVNITSTSQSTFGAINKSLPILHWMAFGMFVAFVIAIMVSNFLVKAHPVFFVVYFLFSVVSIVFSAYISNAYETIATSGVLAASLQQFTALNYIMLHLPIFATIISVLGMITLFIGVSVDSEQGGSII